MCPFSFVRSWRGVLNTIELTPICPNEKFWAVGGFWTRKGPSQFQKTVLAPCPSDADVLPEPCRQRGVNIVVKSAGSPLLVRFARRVRDGRRAIQEHVPTRRRL